MPCPPPGQVFTNAGNSDCLNYLWKAISTSIGLVEIDFVSYEEEARSATATTRVSMSPDVGCWETHPKLADFEYYACVRTLGSLVYRVISNTIMPAFMWRSSTRYTQNGPCSHNHKGFLATKSTWFLPEMLPTEKDSQPHRMWMQECTTEYAGK